MDLSKIPSEMWDLLGAWAPAARSISILLLVGGAFRILQPRRAFLTLIALYSQNAERRSTATALLRGESEPDAGQPSDPPQEAAEGQ
ncbi:hypothetical protein AB0I28_39360 [Phytomonospora sp. NPDC050363]|uniref:hypothetical protein n=1 Tax=Phytomonospora sp. NPDC050363 TaxID=3155642 RepID=UPI0033E0782F